MNQPLHLPLAQSAIDRDYLLRENPNLFAELWANPLTRVLPVYSGKVLLDGQNLRLLLPAEVSDPQLLVYLGKSTEQSKTEPAGTPLVLAVIGEAEANQLEAEAGKWLVLRRSGAGLSARDAGMYAQALAMANWHASHQHCNQCGSATEVGKAGWTRVCIRDGKEIYPRTDPAVIVSIIDDRDRILLGSQGVWEENRWSILAGYVEPGESLNAAVEREMFEESGVRVEDIQFLGSQAWPFPYSLMMGFTARARGEQVQVPDGLEIEKLRWFSREDIRNEASKILLPGPLTIARVMIEHWYGGPIASAAQ